MCRSLIPRCLLASYKWLKLVSSFMLEIAKVISICQKSKENLFLVMFTEMLNDQQEENYYNMEHCWYQWQSRVTWGWGYLSPFNRHICIYHFVLVHISMRTMVSAKIKSIVYKKYMASIVFCKRCTTYVIIICISITKTKGLWRKNNSRFVAIVFSLNTNT